MVMEEETMEEPAEEAMMEPAESDRAGEFKIHVRAFRGVDKAEPDGWKSEA